MFRRKTKSKPSFLTFPSSNRGSDIVRPNNTSLLVNESNEESDFLHRELTSVFSEDEDINLGDTSRRSSSLMKSLSQKKQSTPLIESVPPNKRDLAEKGNSFTQRAKPPRSPKRIFQSSSRENIPYFEEVIRACGATPLPGDSSYLMSEDQTVFSIKVNNTLKEDTEKKKKFIRSLKENIKECNNLQKMLSHTLTAEHCEAARGPVQEPLLRLLLHVDCLQVDLIDLLLNRIADCIVEKEGTSGNAQLVSSILGQMKFLCRTNNAKVASKLFEIIDIAAINVKREIIFLLPEIISEKETEEICIQLVEMLKFDETLTPVIIDAITSLPLNNALRSLVCSKILHRLDKCPLEFLPSLVQFILNRSQAEEVNEVIKGLRSNLPFTPQHYQMREKERKSEMLHSEEDSYIKLTFENLKFSLMASKEFADAWFKSICNLNSSSNFRCIDLVMLIIFYSCLFGKKNMILQIIRNKVKLKVLTEPHVEDMFKILLVIAEEYSSTVLEIASVLLKSCDSKITNFGAKLYKECFIHFHFYMKQVVVSELLLHIGTGLSTTVNAALLVLKDLCESEKEALSQHIGYIMGVLVKVADMELMQVRLLMDVISDLVFCDSSCSGTAAQDELQIFIRKHLTSSKAENCKKGVLAAIMFVKHFGCSGSSVHTQCNSLLDFAMGSNGMSETKRGFFNDEFATMVKEAKLSESFLDLWSKKTFDLVAENLFLKDVNSDSTNFPVSAQYPLPCEGVKKLIFPAAVLINKCDSKLNLNVPIRVIPSTLRLFWCLQGNLNRILPVFYASVIMPDTTAYDNFTSLDDSQKKNIMDCLFLCANYLIECVNAFCAHGILDKAALRIKHLIDVRKLIAKYINMIPDFVPPEYQFHSPARRVLVKKKVSEKKPKRGKKRKLNEVPCEASNSLLETSDDKIPATCSDENIFPVEEAAQETDLCVYSQFFRELDFVTNKLLLTSFKSDATFHETGTMKSSCDAVFPGLETCDIFFLLEDLISKSQQFLKSTDEPSHFKNKWSSSISLKQKITPEEFIQESLKILPGLLSKIETLSNFLENLLDSNDWNYNSRGLYVQGSCHVKLAMAAGLKFITSILTWNGFQNSNDKLLEDVLTVFAQGRNRNKINASVGSLEALAVAAAEYLTKFSKTVLILSGALSIVKTFQVCLRYSSETRSALADLCHEFLCRNWFSVTGAPDRGPLYNQHIDFLLKSYFSYASHKLEMVRAATETALAEVKELTGKDSFLKTFKTINKSNFPLLYRTVCEALVAASEDEFSNAGGDHGKQLHIWSKVVETLLILVDIAKVHSSRAILASLLKRSQSVIQLFLSKGMPIVESALRVKSIEVLTLLKSFQMVTRFLHSICCHSRITNDSVVAAHVPGIRSLCERLTLEVKGMLILNGIPMDCITIAILKNRDIKGNDIISQSTPDSKEGSRPSPETEFKDEKPKLCLSARLLFSMTAFVALFNTSYVRVGISMALVCMTVPEEKNKEGNLKKGEFTWNSATKGYIISAVFYGFILGPFVAGFLTFKFGGKIILVVGTIGTSIMFFLAPETARKSPVLLCVDRATTGFFSGFTLPAFYDLASHWIVPEERQLLVTGALVGIPTANIVNFPLTGALCDACGWIWLFYSMAIWLVVCGVAFCFLIYNHPRNCPFISEKERQFLEKHIPIPTRHGIPWKAILKSLPIHAYIVIHFSINYVSLTIVFSLPVLMKTIHNFHLQEGGLLSAVPFVGSFLIRICSSIFYERLRLKLKMSKNTLRKIFVFLGAFLCSLFIFVITFLTSAYRYWALACFIMATSSLELCLTGGYLLSLLDLCPSYVNVLTGVANSIANAAGLISPVVNGLITPHGTREEWNRVFYVNIGILLSAMTFYLVFGQNHLQSWGLVTLPSSLPVPRASLVN